MDVPAGAVTLGRVGARRRELVIGEGENYEQSPPPTDFTMGLRGVEWEFRCDLKFKPWVRQIFGCRRDQILNLAMVHVII